MIEAENRKLVTEKRIVKIDDVVPNPFNPNQQSDYIFQKMKDTIQSKGLFGSIFVHEFAGVYQILDGEHRWKACKELGWKEIPVEVSPGLEEKDVKFWTIYFNNTHGKDDIEKRAKLYEEIDEGQAQLLPFSEEQMKNEKELFKFDFSKYDEQKEIQASKKTNVISAVVTEEIKALWDRCLMIAKNDGKDISVMLFQMMDGWLELSDMAYSVYKQQKEEARIQAVVDKDIEKNLENEN
jgi:hypothetical protein